MLARLGFILLTAIAASPASADPASEALLRSFIESIDRSPDWSAAAGLIRSEEESTIGEGLTFSREGENVTIGIERLNVVELRSRDGGGFTASRIELTGSALASNRIDYAVPFASVNDISAPGVPGMAFDPHRMMTSIAAAYSALATTEFADFDLPEATSTERVVATETGGTATFRTVYRKVRTTRLRDGLLARLEAGPVTFSVEGADADATRFEIESLVTERLDLGALAHIFDEVRYRNKRGDGIWRPLLARLAYTGLSGSGPAGATFRLDGAAFETVDARQPERPFTRIWDRMLDPAIGADGQSDLALDALRRMYSAFRIGTMRVDAVSVDVPAEKSSFALGGITATSLSTEGLDSFILKDMGVTSPDGYGAVQSLEVAGLIFPDLDVIMQLAALENSAPPDEHNETLLSGFAALPRMSHLSLRGVAAGPSEASAVTLDEFTLDFRDWNEVFAQNTDVRIVGLTVPRALLQLDPQTTEIVDTLGYDRFVLGLSFADRWSPDAGTDQGAWTFTMQDAADIELSYTLTGATVDWMLRATAAAGDTANSHGALMTMLGELGLKGAVLKMTDRSLLDRAFTVAAKKQNLSVAGPAYREQLRGALPFLLSAAVPANLSKLLSAPLQAFMAGGQTLIAEIAPAAPIPLPEIAAAAADPMALPERLGVVLRSAAPAP